MRSERVIFDGITALVRTRAIRTSLIENEYTEMLYAAYPDTLSLRRETLKVPFPKQKRVIDEDGIASVEDDPDDVQRYLAALEPLAQLYPTANTHIARIREFVPLAARIYALSGATFVIDDTRFDSVNLALAYEDFLDSDDYLSGFWGAVRQAILLLDEPAVPVEQRPVEALTNEEKTNPLSPKPTKRGKTGLTVVTSTTPSSKRRSANLLEASDG